MTTSGNAPRGRPLRSAMQLGTTIRAAREDRNWTQVELARRAGVGREWLVAVERGRHSRAEVGMILRVLSALDVELYVARADPERALEIARSPHYVDLEAHLEGMRRNATP
jgi:HTH-type transcriptional regulator/antitoxin HipB